MQITAHYDNPTEERAIAGDLDTIISRTGTALEALVAIRNESIIDVQRAVTDLTRLGDQLAGIRDAMIRRWPGSIAALGEALCAPKSTAQSRHKAIVERPPTAYELWATGELADPRFHTCCQHPGCQLTATHELAIDGTSTAIMCGPHAIAAVTAYMTQGVTNVLARQITT